MEKGIFRISKSPLRAKALLDMAMERLEDIDKEVKTFKVIEQYYEIIKEIITSLMYLDGLKTLSHKLLLLYLKKEYKQFFSKEEFILMDELRILRNEILYYGKKVNSIYLKNKESQIKKIINKIIKICKKKLRVVE